MLKKNPNSPADWAYTVIYAQLSYVLHGNRKRYSYSVPATRENLWQVIDNPFLAIPNQKIREVSAKMEDEKEEAQSTTSAQPEIQAEYRNFPALVPSTEHIAKSERR